MFRRLFTSVRGISSEAGGGQHSSAINVYSATLGGLSALAVKMAYDHFVHLGQDLAVLKDKHYAATGEANVKLARIEMEIVKLARIESDIAALKASMERIEGILKNK